MATRILEATHSYNTTVRLQEQKERNREVAQVSCVITAVTIPPERRCEARMEYRRMCSYEVIKAMDEKSVVIEQGETFALNRSMEGMLLFMGRPPDATQLIKVYSTRLGRGRTVNVFESRWTKPVHVESLGNLYLVGCRRISAPATIYCSNIPPRLKVDYPLVKQLLLSATCPC